MTTNEQCMKDILTFIDENTSVKVRTSSNNDIELRAPGISSILTALSKDNKYSIEEVAFNLLTLQRLKHVGFLYTFTSKYTRKHIRLMNFYKTFTTKDTIVSINDSIRLVSKPTIYFST